MAKGRIVDDRACTASHVTAVKRACPMPACLPACPPAACPPAPLSELLAALSCMLGCLSAADRAQVGRTRPRAGRVHAALFDALPSQYTGQPSLCVVHAWDAPFMLIVDQLTQYLGACYARGQPCFPAVRVCVFCRLR
eukprot:364416-Chlamydomonas_euryale.AAC.3